jgi:hypothetical protein
MPKNMFRIIIAATATAAIAGCGGDASDTKSEFNDKNIVELRPGEQDERIIGNADDADEVPSADGKGARSWDTGNSAGLVFGGMFTQTYNVTGATAVVAATEPADTTTDILLTLKNASGVVVSRSQRGAGYVNNVRTPVPYPNQTTPMTVTATCLSSRCSLLIMVAANSSTNVVGGVSCMTNQRAWRDRSGLCQSSPGVSMADGECACMDFSGASALCSAGTAKIRPAEIDTVAKAMFPVVNSTPGALGGGNSDKIMAQLQSRGFAACYRSSTVTLAALAGEIYAGRSVLLSATQAGLGHVVRIRGVDVAGARLAVADSFGMTALGSGATDTTYWNATTGTATRGGMYWAPWSRFRPNYYVSCQ